MDGIPGCFFCVSGLLGLWCGVQETASVTSALFSVAVKPFEDRTELGFDIGEYEILFVKQVVTLLAKPHQSVLFPLHPFSLDDESNGVFESLG